VFDPGKVNQDRPGPDLDRLLVAQLTVEARHYAQWRLLTGEEEAAAVAELRALAEGRADLLAEVAGILEGTSEGELDEPFVRCAADLCRKAGADPAIPTWIEEGRRRSANARLPRSPAASTRYQQVGTSARRRYRPTGSCKSPISFARLRHADPTDRISPTNHPGQDRCRSLACRRSKGERRIPTR
jgi:hypothetical protein